MWKTPMEIRKAKTARLSNKEKKEEGEKNGYHSSSIPKKPIYPALSHS
jgi:hypothetical protein